MNKIITDSLMTPAQQHAVNEYVVDGDEGKTFAEILQAIENGDPSVKLWEPIAHWPAPAQIELLVGCELRSKGLIASTGGINEVVEVAELPLITVQVEDGAVIRVSVTEDLTGAQVLIMDKGATWEESYELPNEMGVKEPMPCRIEEASVDHNLVVSRFESVAQQMFDASPSLPNPRF